MPADRSEREGRRKVGKLPETYLRDMEHEDGSHTNPNRGPWNSPQEPGKETE